MYVCKLHGEFSSDWCDECGEVLLCDCSDIKVKRVQDLELDLKKGTRIVKYIEHCESCGRIIDINAENKDKLYTLSNISSRFLNEPITHAVLVLLGYTHHPGGYYCAPAPAHGGTYRLEFQAIQFKGGKPVKGTEEWRAFLTHSDLPTIRRFKTLGELQDFHKGMCGGILF